MFCGALRIAATVLSILATQSMVPIAIPVRNRSRTGREPSQMPVPKQTLPVDGDWAVGVGVKEVTCFADGAVRRDAEHFGPELSSARRAGHVVLACGRIRYGVRGWWGVAVGDGDVSVH